MTRMPQSSDGDDYDVVLAPVREGETVAGKYIAGPVIGVGGMGVVIEARDPLLERKVAIKFLLPRLAYSTRAVQRFLREARAAARINSEHVVKLLEVDNLPSGTPYLVMEYIDGIDLKEMLAERGSLPAAEAVDYVLQALQAVAEAHLKGIVHRDLKPSNLFVTARSDGTPMLKVLDFGIAKLLEPGGVEPLNLTGSDDVRLGSPAYMSPEQLDSPSSVDGRADIWAIGVTLYELVCGSQPFQAQTYPDLVLRIASAEPDSISDRRPDAMLSPDLNAVIMRCLDKDPESRFADAAELASALAPFGSESARATLKRVISIPVSPAVAAKVRRSTPPSQPKPLASSYTATLLAARQPKSPSSSPVAASSRKLAPLALAGLAVLTIALIGALIGSVLSRSASLPGGSPSTTSAATLPGPIVPPAVTSQTYALTTAAATASSAPAVEPKPAAEELASQAASPFRQLQPGKAEPGVSQPTPAAGTRLGPATTSTAVKAVSRSSIQAVTNAPPATSANVAAAVAAAPLTTAFVPPGAPAGSAGEGNRSLVIEKLIEQRR